MKGNQKELIVNQPREDSRIPEVYANAAMIHFSPYECELTLGLGSANYEGIDPVINIRMSPQFAKEFSELLQQKLNMFEERPGANVV